MYCNLVCSWGYPMEVCSIVCGRVWCLNASLYRIPCDLLTG
jgi:hypothetical protein